MIRTLFELIFSGLLLILAIYSLIMIYVLLRFGKSKILGMVVSLLYLLLMLSLYAAANDNFNQIPFAKL